MAGETTVTIVGNLTADPELRYTQSGLAVVNFTVASTPKVWDRQRNEFVDGDALFMRCSAWREFAENIAASVHKGTRVVVVGRLVQRQYETREGEKRTTFEVQADEVAPSLRWASATVARNDRNGGAQRPAGGGQRDVWGSVEATAGGVASAPQAAPADSWPAAQPGSGGGFENAAYTDDTPF